MKSPMLPAQSIDAEEMSPFPPVLHSCCHSDASGKRRATDSDSIPKGTYTELSVIQSAKF